MSGQGRSNSTQLNSYLIVSNHTYVLRMRVHTKITKKDDTVVLWTFIGEMLSCDKPTKKHTRTVVLKQRNCEEVKTNKF